jgi:hypothetical protein
MGTLCLVDWVETLFHSSTLPTMGYFHFSGIKMKTYMGSKCRLGQPSTVIKDWLRTMHDNTHAVGEGIIIIRSPRPVSNAL